MKLSKYLLMSLAGLFVVMGTVSAQAPPIRIGVVAEMTGEQAEYGMQITHGIQLYMHEHGDTIAGRKVELIIKDVGGPNPAEAKRLASELVTRDHVDFLAGFGFTPNALAVAPIATEAKIPMIVMNAASSALTTRSPYVVRTSMTIAQNAMGIATWAAKNGIHSVYILYADYAPGKDGAAQFKKTFTAAGGTIVGEVGVPLRNPDFAPFTQRIKDAKPEAAFLWVPSGELANALIKSFRERGLDQAGIKMLGTSDAVDDMFLNTMGDAPLGFLTGGHYSFAHDSVTNKAFIKAYEGLYGTSIRPNFMAVAAYDGMAAIYDAVNKLHGQTDGDKVIEMMKGWKTESPRGPIMIDPQTRDIIQTVYIRRVEKRGSELYNVEFEKFPDVKDPGK